MGAAWLCRMGPRQTQMKKIDYSILEETNVYNQVIQKAMEDVVKRVSEAKEKLLNDAMLQRAKEGKIAGHFVLAEEVKKPFPRIKGFVDHQGNEHYLYNDGSDEGLHLVSFYKEEPKFELSADSRSLGTIGFKYLLCQPTVICFYQS